MENNNSETKEHKRGKNENAEELGFTFRSTTNSGHFAISKVEVLTPMENVSVYTGPSFYTGVIIKHGGQCFERCSARLRVSVQNGNIDRHPSG